MNKQNQVSDVLNNKIMISLSWKTWSCYQLLITCDNMIWSFLKIKHEIFQEFFCKAWKKKHSNKLSYCSTHNGAYCPVTYVVLKDTVVLHCPTNAKIRAANRQSESY